MKQYSSAFLLLAAIATYAMQQQEAEGNWPEWRQRPQPEKFASFDKETKIDLLLSGVLDANEEKELLKVLKNNANTEELKNSDQLIDDLIDEILEKPDLFKWRTHRGIPRKEIFLIIDRPRGAEAIAALYKNKTILRFEGRRSRTGEKEGYIAYEYPRRLKLFSLLLADKEYHEQAAKILSLCLKLEGDNAKEIMQSDSGEPWYKHEYHATTLLDSCVEGANLPCLKVLLSYGANPNLRIHCSSCTESKGVHHPLHTAIKKRGFSAPIVEQIIQVLIDHGAKLPAEHASYEIYIKDLLNKKSNL